MRLFLVIRESYFIQIRRFWEFYANFDKVANFNIYINAFLTIYNLYKNLYIII